MVPRYLRVTRLLLAEMSLVFRSLPEKQAIQNLHTRFPPTQLDSLFHGITNPTTGLIFHCEGCKSCQKDRNKVYQNYINGYIIDEGRYGYQVLDELCTEYMFVQMVKGTTLIVKRKEGKSLPVQ